jgi:hypothetical protein
MANSHFAIIDIDGFLYMEIESLVFARSSLGVVKYTTSAGPYKS